jgi:hypothetical protein
MGPLPMDGAHGVRGKLDIYRCGEGGGAGGDAGAGEGRAVGAEREFLAAGKSALGAQLIEPIVLAPYSTYPEAVGAE